MKIRIFLLALDSVLIEQFMMEAQGKEAQPTTQYPFYLRASNGDRERESWKTTTTTTTVQRRGSLDSWKKILSNAKLCGVYVCVYVYCLRNCERACMQVYLENVKNECRIFFPRNQNNGDGVSLLNGFNRG